MNNKVFEYKDKLSYTHFITPLIGLFALYVSVTNESGLAYRGNLVLPYPASSYFFALAGALMIIPLLWVFLKIKKVNYIELTEKELKFTKGILRTRNKNVRYNAINEITFENDEDDGKSILIETEKFFGNQFYAKKFKSTLNFSIFCDEIKERSKTIKEIELRAFMLAGVYFVYGYGGIETVIDIIKKRKNLTNSELVKSYSEIFIFPYEKDQKNEISNIFQERWNIFNREDLLTKINTLKTKESNYKAWNYVRIMDIASMGYATEFLTKEEVKEIALEVLPLVQKNYENWNLYYEDFIKGRIDWSSNDNDVYELKKIAKEITSYETSIYKVLPLNL